MLAAFISPVKFSKIGLAVWNFVRSLKFYYKNNFCQSLLLKSLEIRLFDCKLNSRKRRKSLSVFHRNTPEYSNDQGRKLYWNWRREKHRITRHYSGKLQTTKQTLTTSKHSIEFTYREFPYHSKANRDKVALTNRRWTCKKGKRLMINVKF